MNQLWNALPVLAAPFVACMAITALHSYVGLHVIKRGVIFVDLALAQCAALGAAQRRRRRDRRRTGGLFRAHPLSASRVEPGSGAKRARGLARPDAGRLLPPHAVHLD